MSVTHSAGLANILKILFEWRKFHSISHSQKQKRKLVVACMHYTHTYRLISVHIIVGGCLMTYLIFSYHALSSIEI